MRSYLEAVPSQLLPRRSGRQRRRRAAGIHRRTGLAVVRGLQRAGWIAAQRRPEAPFQTRQPGLFDRNGRPDHQHRRAAARVSQLRAVPAEVPIGRASRAPFTTRHRQGKRKSSRLTTAWPGILPLDVSLYTFSFEFLLSSVQHDTFGHYESNTRTPYLTDHKVHGAVADFHDQLALIAIEIRRRNQTRPMPYPFQLPSQIPNSISI